MKVLYSAITFAVLIFAVATECRAFAFLDPVIPDGEALTYTSKTDNSTSLIREKTIIKKDGSREIYEITSASPALDLVVRIDKSSMAVLYVEQIKKFREVTLASKIDILNERPDAGTDEVKLVHYSTLKYLLRGFPFSEGRRLRISYYGESPKKRFPMSVICQKKESLTVQGRKIECYPLEFGLDGFFSAFFTKSKLWYSAEPPHYLVRTEGPAGPPGAPESTVELVERIVEKR